jgi:phosphodiesterase/alkaline phosphatase D-like protein
MRKFLITAALLLTLGAWGVAQTNDSVNIVGSPQVRAQNNTAVISWQTDKNSATQVKYGTDQNNMSQKAYEAGGSKNHNVTLQNLQPGKTYYYAILDNDGNVRQQGQFVAGQGGSQSAGNTGNTNTGSSSGSTSGSTGAQDNVQILAGPVVQNLQTNSATLWWQTDDRAATHVKYGTDQNNPSQSAYEPGGDRNHSVQLTNLQPGQTYYYQVMRQNGTVRTNGQFSTPGSNASNTGNSGQSSQTAQVQITKGPVIETVGDKYAIVTWQTAQPASSDVRVGTDPNNLPMTATSQWGTTHRVQLGGLQPNTHYYFVIGSSQQPGQQQATSTGQFQTVNTGQAAVNTGAGTWHP